jgi:hypothetical protein
MTQRYRHLVFLGLGVPLFLAGPASGQSTSWTGATGNWGVPTNWTNGEPTAALDAIVPGAAMVNVTMAGETCRNLFVGTSFDNPRVVVNLGNLTVLHRIQVPLASSGTINQESGTVSADSLVLGAATTSIGHYSIGAGTLSVNHLVIGRAEAGSQANFTTTIANPTVNVAHTITIGAAANIVHGAGTLNAGTSSADSVIVLGAWQMANRPTTTVTNFVMRPSADFNATILPQGITPVVSTGAAILGGTLQVFDVLAPDGTYELLRGNPLTGMFDTVVLPSAGNWSWRIEGNSFLVTRGTVPVEPTTWSRVKLRLPGESR